MLRKVWKNITSAFPLAPYQVFACSLVSFMVGTLLALLLSSGWSSLAPYFLLCVLLFFFSALVNFLLNNRILVLISWLLVFFLLGMARYNFMESRYFCTGVEDGQKVSLIAKIVSDPNIKVAGQEFIVSAAQPGCQNLRLLVKTNRFPAHAYGESINLEGNLQKPGMIEDFDYAKYLKPKKVSFILTNPSLTVLNTVPEGIAGRVTLSLYGIKHGFEATINKLLPEPEASLGIGIITGSKGNLSQELVDNLNTVGLTHIVALSGYNVTIIIIALSAILSAVISRKKVFWIGFSIVALFIIMTGASSSVVRAGIFSLLVMLGRYLGRRAHQTNILLFTAAIMIFFNPFVLLNDVGFQLSFIAFAGLIYLSAPITALIEKSSLKKLPAIIKAPLGETLSAQTAVFPLIAFAFGRISIISPVSNVLVLSILPLSMLLSCLAGAIGSISLIAGKFLAFIAWPLLAYVVAVAKYLSLLPLSSVNAGKYNLILIIIMYAIILTLTILTKRWVKRWQKQSVKQS